MKKNFKMPSMRRIALPANHSIGIAAEIGLPKSASSEAAEIENSGHEKSRILKRLIIIVGDNEISADRVGIQFSPTDLRTVFSALREHASRGTPPNFEAKNEVHQYILESLFADLVEEPSNILYTTRTGADTMRYDAMKPAFWIECLDLLEQTLCA